MDLIPADILREITKYLRFEDKFECTLVCRNWYIAITFHGLLYHKIELFEGHNLKNAVTTFKRPGNEELIQAVQELEVYFPCDDINLITIFSNLRKLTSGFVTYSEFDFMEMEDRICDMAAYERSVQKLKRLEYIVEDNLHYPIVMPILKSPHKPVYLKHISYAFYNYAFSQGEMQVSAAFNYDAKLRPMIPLLKNAPNLTFLELKRLYITPFDLEEIHDQYAPNLTTLKLTDVFAGFDANATQMLAKKAFPHIQHTKQITLKKLALKIKSFTLEFDQHMLGIQTADTNAKHNSKNLWLKYVAAKYPSLTELSINIAKIHETYLLKGVFDKLWMSSLSRLTHLTRYDMKFCQLSGPLLKAMDKSNIRLEKLSVYIHEKTIGIQIKGLEESAQRHTVKQLEIFTKGNVTQEGKVGSGILLLLPLFTGLKTLKMFKESLNRKEGYEHRMIPHLLHQAPHLEHLMIRFVNISRMAEENLTLPEHSNLKYLELKHFYCDSAKQLRAFSQTMNQYVFGKCPQLIKFAGDLYPPQDRSAKDPFIWELILDRNPHLTTVKIMYQLGDSIFHIVSPQGPVPSRWCKQAFCYDKLRPISEPPKGTWYIRIFIPHSILLNKKRVA
ncbi:hypothetical protein V8B55DRAFT_1537036 [Mucor lusitanicus]|uniref:F-box domain-containing protein n=2 Tax=Mucor circinelloides f. lusitanicus TaxID=29924 RepID=A0A168N2G4_MUCCL|nr:hypothetical protein FB192DRAFT_1385923 [Mucor lusitanicus]OAD05689.1 hypothetical protein MUCCIDRAFT_79225 [Mucor lusitanicus CBS 277.49]